ncbi:O-antigen ligase family protein [Syntrophus aciditrophicus]|uniref:O-antigen polymerase n=1 Tax=Syntrophus aciditrophicus (strain SB) TaxID=56780 RepID=Q2LRM7_SYNAS|nr:O-antigen ligase family protein [Syntrophus aciditrophicus]ABC76737.1 o-antigen polymerase [Syntrophus aciditrophicus SB]OPY17073.1 MAG: hypothetical protein A4E74_01516 [Syntrophus sp. PtaB.Bin075]
MVLQSDRRWAISLDRFCMIMGSLLPAGIVAGNAGFESIIILVDMAWILRWVLLKENPLQKQIIIHPLILPWIFWFGTMIVSLLINGQEIGGWGHDIAFIRYLLFVVALIDISQRLPVQKYLIVGMGVGVVWAVINLLSAHIIGYDLFGRPLIRYAGKLKESARIAGLFAYVAPFFLGWAVSDKNMTTRRRIFIAVAGAFALVLVLQTNIRTTFLASAAGIAIYLIYFLYKKSRWTIVIPALFFAGIALIAKFWIPYFNDLSSIYDRIYIWKVALAMWQEHPLFGVGVGSFQDAYKSVAASGIVAPFVAPDGNIFSAPEAAHAHNFLLMLLACGGIAGFSMFVWLFVNAVRRMYRKPDGWRIGLISWPVVALLIGLTGWSVYSDWYQAVFAYFIVLAGCCDELRGPDPRHSEPGKRRCG